MAVTMRRVEKLVENLTVLQRARLYLEYDRARDSDGRDSVLRGCPAFQLIEFKELLIRLRQVRERFGRELERLYADIELLQARTLQARALMGWWADRQAMEYVRGKLESFVAELPVGKSTNRVKDAMNLLAHRTAGPTFDASDGSESPDGQPSERSEEMDIGEVLAALAADARQAWEDVTRVEGEHATAAMSLRIAPDLIGDGFGEAFEDLKSAIRSIYREATLLTVDAPPLSDAAGTEPGAHQPACSCNCHGVW